MASLWDDVGSMFSNVNWGNVITQAVPRAISAGTSVYANNRAASIARDAGQRNADIAQQYGNAAQQRLVQQQTASEPGMTYLRRVAATPTVMTPEQQFQLEQIQRNTATTLNRGGLAGSGRAVTSALRNVNNDAVTKFMATNQQRADQAAGTLAHGYYGAGAAAAGVDQNTGQRVGNAVERGMLPAADATTANARVTGSAFGDISSYIAADSKGRASKYAPRQQEEA